MPPTSTRQVSPATGVPRATAALEFKATEEELACGAAVRRWLTLLKDADLAEDPSAQRTGAALIQAAGSSPLAVQAWIAARRGDQEPHDGQRGRVTFSRGRNHP